MLIHISILVILRLVAGRQRGSWTRRCSRATRRPRTSGTPGTPRIHQRIRCKFIQQQIIVYLQKLDIKLIWTNVHMHVCISLSQSCWGKILLNCVGWEHFRQFFSLAHPIYNKKNISY